MQNSKEDDYLKLKKFLFVFSERFFNLDGLPSEQRPLAVLDELEKTNKEKAFKGLMQAINDCVEMSSRMAPNVVNQLDVELKSERAITLSALRKQYSKTYVKIITSGKVKNETEYYLVRNILDDDSVLISNNERVLLEKLLYSFELLAVKQPLKPKLR